MQNRQTNKKLRDIFEGLVGDSVELVATTDHIYVSPPLRLIDSHQRLQKIKNSKILVWDIIKPNLQRYKQEIVIDTGLYSPKEESFFIFNPEDYYFLQRPRDIKFSKIKENTKAVLDKLSMKNVAVDTYLKRLSELLNIYKEITVASHSALEFYQQITKKFYELITPESGLVDYFSENSIGVYESNLISTFVPVAISIYREEFEDLISNGFFKKPYIHNLRESMEESSTEDILSSLKDRQALPANQLFLWALAKAGIQHYGNDFGFFEKYSAVSGTDYTDLQYTKPKQDGKNFVTFQNSLSFRYDIEKDSLINTSSKLSRINDITNVMLHVGTKNFSERYQDYIKTGSESQIKMGEILYSGEYVL